MAKKSFGGSFPSGVDLKEIESGRLAISIHIPEIAVSTACSGQITVATAGTAVRGTDASGLNGFLIKAHPNNLKPIWFGNDGAGDVTKDNGFPLQPGESVIVSVSNLEDLWFDAENNGEKVCWHKA